MDNFNQIAKLFKTHRRFIGMTQKEVAEELNIPYQDYQKYEYGLHIPKINRFRDICQVLGIPKNNIFYRLKP